MEQSVVVRVSRWSPAHDIVAHSLAVVIVQADGGRYAGAEKAVDVLGIIGQTARSALGEVHGVIEMPRDEPARPSEHGRHDELGSGTDDGRDGGLGGGTDDGEFGGSGVPLERLLGMVRAAGSEHGGESSRAPRPSTWNRDFPRPPHPPGPGRWTWSATVCRRQTGASWRIGECVSVAG